MIEIYSINLITAHLNFPIVLFSFDNCLIEHAISCFYLTLFLLNTKQ